MAPKIYRTICEFPFNLRTDSLHTRSYRVVTQTGLGFKYLVFQRLSRAGLAASGPPYGITQLN
jgi:hypothetical protein